MIRISPATVKQAGLDHTPGITRRVRLGERAAAALDAVLVMLPEGARPEAFSMLPQAERWRELYTPAPAPGSVVATRLANHHHTRAVVGVLPRRAGTFETLFLAGRMMKEAGEARALALATPGAASDREVEALLAAALAQDFPLPSFRARPRPRRLSRVELIGTPAVDLRRALAGARGTNLVRHLTALPPNVLTAPAYRRFIGELARRHGLGFNWLDERDLKRLGCGAFLAVSAGNAARTAGIAHLRYRPAGRAPRSGAPDLALVGKGILFDTGGTNLKSHRGMLDMHTDMSGSAVALATLTALAQLRAPIAADAWLAITENRTGPTAYVPQDVVRAANGLTIQVIHTDAEGRMVLADTLALAGRTRPRLMMDFATLTGACVTALTERYSGGFANRPDLAAALVEAGRSSGERVWSFPLDADFDADLESKVADIMQCAVEGKGDHILAARFLGRFVPEQVPWIHLDLSSASRSGGLGHVTTDVTGFGVRCTLSLLLEQRILDRLGKDAR